MTERRRATHIRLAEALVFASADPVPARVLAACCRRMWRPRTCCARCPRATPGAASSWPKSAAAGSSVPPPDLAPRLTRVIQRPRRLPRVAMETLAIIAWHQPVTRAQIEEIRGATLGQVTLDALLEAGLVAPPATARCRGGRRCGQPRRSSWPSSA